jgi:thiol-disulfide isomerase/thioredoxin
MVGDPAPSFEAAAVDGSMMALDELAGEPRVLVFWATWCQPCLAEIPVLEAIEAKHPGRVISVSLDEGGADDVRRFLDKRPLPYRVLLGDAELFARYDGMGIPHTVLLDRELKVVAVHRGVVDQKSLERELASL